MNVPELEFKATRELFSTKALLITDDPPRELTLQQEKELLRALPASAVLSWLTASELLRLTPLRIDILRTRR